uniref:SKP1 component dimerisation domain-containing protein n=1 Tax=Alexandrium monilatum TaxID=311494 RepID=A0A7S4PXH3_9DINO
MAGSSASEDLVRLRSAEGEVFAVPRRAACMSTVVRGIVDGKGAVDEVPLPVTEYCRHHDGMPPPEIRKPFQSPDLSKYGASEWDAAFAQAVHEQRLLHELTLAAHELGIGCLLDLLCSKTACLIQGKSMEEIRREFSIGADAATVECRMVSEG